jgi:hypothetical protein
MLLIPPKTEIVRCTQPNTSTDQGELNGFGLKIYKHTYLIATQISFNQLSSVWLLFNPSQELKMSRNDQIDNRIPLENHNVTLAFGSLISPYQFKCADLKFLFIKNYRSKWSIFFAKHNSFVSINMENSRFNLKRDHIDSNRGVIIDVKSGFSIIVHICLRGNLDEYTLQNREHGTFFFLFLLLNRSFYTRVKHVFTCFLPLRVNILIYLHSSIFNLFF